jgi:DNA-binding response OmpR family regulator
MERETVLVIEDDRDLAHLLELHLADIGLAADCAYNGDVGLQKATEGAYVLVVLDLMLPGTDGITICRRLRRRDTYIPIMMVTARSQEIDKILGLEIGADDYITKPFSPGELAARVKALLRRTRNLTYGVPADGSHETIRIGELVIDVQKHRVHLGGSEVNLTAKEFDLLTYFARHPGQAFSREQLLDHVWHYRHDGYNHTVNSHINRLRSKIENDPSKPRYIMTVWGYGYRFAEPQEIEGADG